MDKSAPVFCRSFMNASCQCGLVQFTCPLNAPIKLYICHCIDCKRQSASLFSTTAIFPRFDIASDNVIAYTYTAPSGKIKDCYSCSRCGSRLINSKRGADTITVKGGCLIDGASLDWESAEQLWTKRKVKGWNWGSGLRWKEDPGGELFYD